MKRLLIVGYGDIAQRALPRLEGSFDIVRGARRYGFDLDLPQTLAPGPVDAVLHLAPPPATADADTRTANLLAALEKNPILPARMVYVSTSGVYGDCAGARVNESRPIEPRTPRAHRRADAEAQLTQWCAAHGADAVVLRVPGIYAPDRLPLERLREGLPVLRAEEDVYTNHIHADDLAAALVRALDLHAPAGIYNVCDDSDIKAGDWFDLVADYAGLPRPRRVTRSELVDPHGFMRESRRLDNRRLKLELGIRLRYPTVREGLSHEHAIGVN
jgi:nucleoside-diphosphate-sugar epimerase